MSHRLQSERANPICDRWLGFIGGVLGILLLFQQSLLADSIVSQCDEAGLRAALIGGGTVTFACDGTITLTNTITVTNNTALDGSGRSVTISGGNTVRIFTVVGGVRFDLKNLTLADGFAAGGGSGYPIPYFNGVGGGICSTGQLYVTHCVFTNNSAAGKSGTPDSVVSTAGMGGAIFNAGTLVVSNTAFAGNLAVGGNGTVYLGPTTGGDGSGGAIYSDNSATIINCTFLSNSASGGNGGDAPMPSPGIDSGARGGNGNGAGIHNAGMLSVFSSTFSGNSALGGTGGSGSSGANWALSGGPGGQAGIANGGGFCSAAGNVVVVNCTFFGNSVIGGGGGKGGDGGGGMLHYEPGYAGGSGANGGNGSAGGLCSLGGTLNLTNITCAGNLSMGGTGGAGGSGGPGGPGGARGANGAAGAVGVGRAGNIAAAGGSLVLKNTIVSSSSGGPNAFGTIVDSGYNLSSDASCSFSSAGSLNSTDPQITSLGDYGGPTRTIPLLPASPAIDAGDDAASPTTDQRGVARPHGAHSDMGAFEYDLALLPLAVSASFATNQIPALEKTSLRIQITNPNPITVSNVSFIVNLPASVEIANPSNVVNEGDGSILAVPGALQWSGTGFTLTGFQSRTVFVDVSSAQVGLRNNGRISASNAILGTSASALPELQVVLPSSYASITECQDIRLRLGLLGGGLVTFACDGTIVLTNYLTVTTNTTLDATGHAITISGSNALRLFNVPAGVSLTLMNLTLADGRSTNGGAIYNDGGEVHLINAVVTRNAAVGSTGNRGTDGTNGLPGNPQPGTSGSVGTPGGNGQPRYGGAVFNQGIFTAFNCSFVSNSATGGIGGIGGTGGRSGYGAHGANGGGGGIGGLGEGGAIFNAVNGLAMLTNSLFAYNTVTGGRGGGGGTGGDLGSTSGSGGPGGLGGQAWGAACYALGGAFFVNCTLTANSAAGGQGAAGGVPGLQGFDSGTNGAPGAGGDGRGGGLIVGGPVQIEYCTVASNRAAGGLDGGTSAVAGFADGGGIGVSSGSATLRNSLVANNSGSNNCFGVILDAGHNLCSDNSAAFLAPTSRNQTDPQLGPLADNGGPTRTMALLAGSPAIDGGIVVAGITTDQRGVSRSDGSAPDIGAYEWSDSPGYTSFQLLLPKFTNGFWLLELTGSAGSSVRLQKSSNLSNWQDVATSIIGAQGKAAIPDATPSPYLQFYRTVSP